MELEEGVQEEGTVSAAMDLIVLVACVLIAHGNIEDTVQLNPKLIDSMNKKTDNEQQYIIFVL